MGAEFSDNKIFKNISGQHDHQKAQQGGGQGPTQHVVVAYTQVIMIVWIELVDISLHPKVRERVNDIGNGYEGSVQSISRRAESAFAGEKVGIEKAQCKAYIYDAG